MTTNFQEVPIQALFESPLNPRKTFPAEDQEGLVESVREQGILQPIVVRPLKVTGGRPGDMAFEVVCGHRRLRAAKSAELTAMPCVVRELTDSEALEVMVVENQQRTDIHPLEEAIGYQALHEDHGVEVEEIAAKVGKSKAYVYGRMKLCALGADGQKALLGDEMSAAVAMLVARVPDELQGEALRSIRIGMDPSSTPTVAWASKVLRDRFTLRLKSAPFKPDDAGLVECADACTDCPKRTGNQPELFADIQSADLCTDPVCFADKSEAAWRQKTAKLFDKGVEVLTIEESDAALYDQGNGEISAQGGFVRPADRCYDDQKQRTYGELLGLAHPGRVVARTPAGKTVTLYRKKGLRDLLKAAGHDFRKARSKAAKAAGANIDRQIEGDKADRLATIDARRQALRRIIAKVDRAQRLPDAVLREFADSAIGDFNYDAEDEDVDAILDARGLERGKASNLEALEEVLEFAKPADLPALLVELTLVGTIAYPSHSPKHDLLGRIAKAMGIDLPKLVTQAKAAAKKKAADEKKAKKAGK